MEEIAAYGLGAAPIDAEYTVVETKPNEPEPAPKPNTAQQVLAQYDNVPVKNDRWLISLARTEQAEVFWNNTTFFVCVFPDRSYVVYNFNSGEERRVDSSTLTPEEHAHLRAGNGFKRVFG